MQLDVSNLLSVLLGGLLVFAAQWLSSRQSAKTEAQKWKQEEIREGRRDIVRFRQERARPIIEALDRATRRWDPESYFQLADQVGYQGEKVENSEEHQEQVQERRERYVNQLVDDISAATTIHDEEVRKLVIQVLWQSTEPEADSKYEDRLREAYLQLENWIFKPQQSSTPASDKRK